MLSSKVGKITKVVVCGMKSVGKTTILEQVIYGNFDKGMIVYPTIEDIYVANIETDRGTKEKIRFYDVAGIDESVTSTGNGASVNQQLPRHYFGFADGYILVYDVDKPASLDILVSIKKDIERNKEKKEIVVVVLGNQMKNPKTTTVKSVTSDESVVNKASAWCAREKLRHYVVDSHNRNSLYEPFVYLASKLSFPPNKSTFSQLSMGRKASKVENS